MAHRDERLAKTLEARLISHDPLIEDDTEQDEPMFEEEQVLDADRAAKQEESENRERPVGRDEEANAENSAEPDQSANVADANISGDQVTKAEDVKPKRRARKAKEE